MSADPIIYCLENLTDYRQFERFSSDLMAGSGYPDIEPIGGSSDRGRDAIHVSRTDDSLTIFAYSVRSDWKKKLREDCDRIVEEEYNPKSMVFVCTARLTAAERDNAIRDTENNYGWTLHLYEIERIRVLLSGNLRHLLAVHPSIFSPPWFPSKGGLSVAECRDTIVIEHLESDHFLATWLSKKLSIAGYKTWCYGISPMAGENKDDTLAVLIEQRAIQFLPIVCSELFGEAECLGRIGAAARKDNFVIPCWSEDLRSLNIKFSIVDLEPASFFDSWSDGLAKVLEQLEARNIPVDLDRDRGKFIALSSYMPEPLTKPVTELIYANVFPATTPNSILLFEFSEPISESSLEELRKLWAFSKITLSKVMAFDFPPDNFDVISDYEYVEFSWKDMPDREGRRSVNVVKELTRRSLLVACETAGLKFCQSTKNYHFTEKKNNTRNNVPFTHVDGRNTRVAVTGTGQSGWGDRAVVFRYQLCPKFIIEIDEQNVCWVRTNIYVRVTDSSGKPYEGKEINRKRKKVTKSWWNKQWLARTLGVMQALATDDKSIIKIGSVNRSVQVSTQPLQWECPISIDVEAVERIGDFQQEIASAREVKAEQFDSPLDGADPT